LPQIPIGLFGAYSGFCAQVSAFLLKKPDVAKDVVFYIEIVHPILSSEQVLLEKFTQDLHEQIKYLIVRYLITDIMLLHFEPLWSEQNNFKQLQLERFIEVYYSERGNLQKLIEKKGEFFLNSESLVQLANDAYGIYLSKTVLTWEFHANQQSKITAQFYALIQLVLTTKFLSSLKNF
jgi:hypothetical protein